MKKNFFKLSFVCLLFLFLAVFSIFTNFSTLFDSSKLYAQSSSGTSSTSSATASYVPDSLGRKIPISNYQKIGILNPAVIRNLSHAYYKFTNVVGVDSYSKDAYKEILPKNIEIIGDFNGPNLEKIVSLKIDLLVIDISFPQKIKDEIEKLKINYFVFSTFNTYGGIKKDIENLFKLFKIDNKIIFNITNDINKKEGLINNISKKFKNKKTLIVVWYENGFMCAGKDSFLSSFFEKFGFSNLINTNGYPTISDETFLKLNPDHILIASSYLNKDILNKDIYKNVNAVKNGSIVTIDSELENKLLQPSRDTWDAFIYILNNFKK